MARDQHGQDHDRLLEMKALTLEVSVNPHADSDNITMPNDCTAVVTQSARLQVQLANKSS